MVSVQLVARNKPISRMEIRLNTLNFIIVVVNLVAKVQIILNNILSFHYFLYDCCPIIIVELANTYPTEWGGQPLAIQTKVFCADNLVCNIRRKFLYVVNDFLFLCVSASFFVVIQVIKGETIIGTKDIALVDGGYVHQECIVAAIGITTV